jgi:hypothetical protein
VKTFLKEKIQKRAKETRKEEGEGEEIMKPAEEGESSSEEEE